MMISFYSEAQTTCYWQSVSAFVSLTGLRVGEGHLTKATTKVQNQLIVTALFNINVLMTLLQVLPVAQHLHY